MITFLLQDTGGVYGAERATADLVEGLTRHGQPCRVLLIREDRLAHVVSPLADLFTRAGASVDTFPVQGRFSKALVRHIRDAMSANPGVLHSVGYKANLHARVAAGWLRRRFPVACTVHGWLYRPDLKERFYGWIDMCVLRAADAVITLSRYYEGVLLRGGVSRRRLHRIPSGLKREELSSIQSPDWGRTPVVGILGRLSWEKNHGLFLDGAAQLIRGGIRCSFLVAGDGPDLEAAQRRATDLGISKYVEFAGRMTREAFFSRVHVLALTSRIENLPYCVLEAMACSRPVVATRVGGLTDLVDDGRTGYLVPEDSHRFADAVRRLLHAPEQAIAMGRQGHQKLDAEFSMDGMIMRHVALYTELAPQEAKVAS